MKILFKTKMMKVKILLMKLPLINLSKMVIRIQTVKISIIAPLKKGKLMMLEYAWVILLEMIIQY